MVSFCVAQTASRLTPGDVCVPFPNDTRLLIPPRLKGAAHFIMPGMCEFDTMSFVLHFLRKDGLFVDAGSYIGAYTILASGAVGGRSIAFEPSATTFQYLQCNVRLNNMDDRVTLVNSALGSEDGTVRFTKGLGTENYICLTSTNDPTDEVRVTSLDKALSGLSPMLIKIDVEGFESKVIAGARETLAQPSLQALIIERSGNADRYGDDEDRLHQQIRNLAFTPCAYSPLNRTLKKLSRDDNGNIIYIRNFGFVQKRLQEAAPYRFAGRKI